MARPLSNAAGDVAAYATDAVPCSVLRRRSCGLLAFVVFVGLDRFLAERRGDVGHLAAAVPVRRPAAETEAGLLRSRRIVARHHHHADAAAGAGVFHRLDRRLPACRRPWSTARRRRSSPRPWPALRSDPSGPTVAPRCVSESLSATSDSASRTSGDSDASSDAFFAPLGQRLQVLRRHLHLFPGGVGEPVLILRVLLEIERLGQPRQQIAHFRFGERLRRRWPARSLPPSSGSLRAAFRSSGGRLAASSALRAGPNHRPWFRSHEDRCARRRAARGRSRRSPAPPSSPWRAVAATGG